MKDLELYKKWYLTNEEQKNQSKSAQSMKKIKSMPCFPKENNIRKNLFKNNVVKMNLN